MYTGYYVWMEYYGSGSTLNEYQLYGDLQPNLWTRVQMQITASSGSIAVAIPGASNTPVVGHFDPASAADVFIGPQSSGSDADWTVYFDNIVVYATRSK